ncbi:hypothetical protein EXN66_Car021085 [Channa argus]|uniref:Uncharacterized protein n=1 Tax=Channa argus TaxID=215402 RepID=A0A6G1QSC6_CHAAH|nr:hypothetical protein EXN66_Car021085 [Channa argus]
MRTSFYLNNFDAQKKLLGYLQINCVYYQSNKIYQRGFGGELKLIPAAIEREADVQSFAVSFLW